MRVRPAKGLGGIAPALALTAAALPALAAPSAGGEREPVAVRYSAPPGCPSEAVFLGELFSRTDRARPAGPGEPARAFDVTLQVGPEGAIGELVATDEGGVRHRRAMSGADCTEVAGALALVIAVTVDPAARTGPPTASAPTSRAPAAPLENVSPPPEPPPPPPPPPPTPAVAAETAPERGFVPLWSVGAEVHGAAGLVPAAALGGGLYVGVEDDSDDLVSPSLRLGVHAAFASAALDGDVGAQITWVVLRLEGCPIRPRLSPSVRVDVCATFDGGGMQTRGTGLDRPSASLREWFAAGALARAAWIHSSGLRLELSGGLEAPLRRYPFELATAGQAGAEEVYRIGPVGGAVTLGVGTELP